MLFSSLFAAVGSRFVQFYLAMLICLASTLPASALQLNGASLLAGEAVEGGVVIATVPAGALVTLNDMPVTTDADGRFIIGFHRDSPDIITLRVTGTDGITQQTDLTARQRVYDIQRIDGLKSSYVSPPDDVLARIAADADDVKRARTLHDAGDQAGDFLGGFDMPVTGRITGIYGSQRILNGAPRAPHYGIDIAAARGTPVLAPAGGRVTLVKDLYFSGWTVLITHGFGLNAAFLHLDSVSVASGDIVRRGTPIGTVGSTGRSTGPHLDWRLDWQGRRLDAALVRRQIAASRTSD
ncbi:MAG: peptidase M23 [SAR116 cluster bacterium]|nr:peptidase M23 [SAR116 cluster bacterium]